MGVRSTNQSNFEGQTSGFDNINYAGVGPDYKGPVMSATGGTKATPGDGYTYHLFTSSGPFNITADGDNATMKVLMVGGGGGGGYDRGGGGGAGGMAGFDLSSIVSNTTVTIGAGGNGSTSGPTNGNSGGDTTWNYPTGTITSAGGGGGGSDAAPNSKEGSGGNTAGGGGAAGSGGGGHSDGNGGPVGTQPNSDPTTQFRNPGAKGGNPVSNGGGGGGAGSGGPAVAEVQGGQGQTLPWIPTAYGTPAPQNGPGSLSGGGYFAGGE